LRCNDDTIDRGTDLAIGKIDLDLADERLRLRDLGVA